MKYLENFPECCCWARPVRQKFVPDKGADRSWPPFAPSFRKQNFLATSWPKGENQGDTCAGAAGQTLRAIHDNRSPLDLNRYRGSLRLLAEIELSPRLRAKEDASDIVQQSLLEAHRDLAAYRGKSEAELVGWLKKILVHNLDNARRQYGTRKRDVKREQSLAERLEQSSARIEKYLASEQTSPSQRAVRNEQVEQLADGLAKLLDAERTAIVLKHFQGWSLSQISTHLDRPTDAVAGLLKRGLKKLRSHLNGSE